MGPLCHPSNRSDWLSLNTDSRALPLTLVASTYLKSKLNVSHSVTHLNYNLIHFLLNVVFHHCSISAWLALASKTKLDAGFKRSFLYLKPLRKFCFLCSLSYCALKTQAKILYAFIHTDVRGCLLYNWSITYCTNYSFCEVPQLDCILCNSVKI